MHQPQPHDPFAAMHHPQPSGNAAIMTIKSRRCEFLISIQFLLKIFTFIDPFARPPQYGNSHGPATSGMI